jgi:hypothetical protein
MLRFAGRLARRLNRRRRGWSTDRDRAFHDSVFTGQTHDPFSAALRIRCPDRPGRYTLAIDRAHEGIAWFSRAGVPALRVPMRVV